MNRNDQQFMAQKIRAQYLEKQTTEIDELRTLDARVKRPANIFAYIFGSLAAIIMGCGMSLVMTDLPTTLGLSDGMIPGIIIGVVGMILALVNYPIYKGLLGARKKKYADRILHLSEKLMQKQSHIKGEQ